MIVMIDNYDSFTWNVVQLIERVSGEPLVVVRNDEFDPDALLQSKPKAIIVSPGPGTPDRAGRVLELIRANESTPLLGVCLGHQAIGEAFGGRVVRAPLPVHGKTSTVTHNDSGIFRGVPQEFPVVRYHSLVVEKESVPQSLSIEALSEDGLVMGLRHRERPFFGVQFHPESYASAHGDVIIANFLSLSEGQTSVCPMADEDVRPPGPPPRMARADEDIPTPGAPPRGAQ